MNNQKETEELWNEIKKDIFRINEKGLFEYTKFAINSLYYSILKDEDVTIRCSKELIKKLKENKSLYRINSNIDEFNVQYMRVYDYVKENSSKYIKVYASLYFYDNLANNSISSNSKKVINRYINDIWILTFKCDSNVLKRSEGNVCSNCGSIMKYNSFNNTYECVYCKNLVKFDGAEEELELTDIEILKD